MQEAVPVGQGAMAAILGLDGAALDEICREAAQGEVVSPANLNSPGPGRHRGKRRGRGPSRRIGQGAWRQARHHAQRQRAFPLRSDEARARPPECRPGCNLQWKTRQVPLVNNVNAQVVTSASARSRGLKQQVTSPVRWEESIRRLRQEGVELFVEVGPGKVLSGLVRQIDRAAAVPARRGLRHAQRSTTTLSR